MATLSYWQQLDALVAAQKAAKMPPKGPRTQIEAVEWLIVFKMQRDVRFVPGTSHKRFGNYIVNSLDKRAGVKYI
jgi:hypothetical protein